MMLWWVVAAVLVFASAEPDPQSVEIIGPQVHYGNVIEGRILHLPSAQSARVVGPQVHYGDVIADRSDLVYYGADYYVRAGDACSGNPCGRNTYCEVGRTGAAVCRCLEGYFPKPDTITGCDLQCHSNAECTGRNICHHNKCVNPCEGVSCGGNAYCEVASHGQGVCKCFNGYRGNAHSRCERPQEVSQSREPYCPTCNDNVVVVQRAQNHYGSSNRVHRPPVTNKIHRGGAVGFRVSADLSDPCVPSPCGRNSACRDRGNRPVCECLPGYFGNAIDGCIAGECEVSTDCPRNKKCENYNCVDPCIACGQGAECRVTQHIPVCYCPSGYTGDPHRNCRHLTEADICHPNPCGVNAVCKAVNIKAQCRCAETYIGDPLRGCRHECDRDTECGHQEKCLDFKCKNPCLDACGENAECNVVNHNAVCSCPEDFLGSPYDRCYPECVEHAECPRHMACFSFQCVDPCIGVCGIGAQCEVTNHKAICSCPPDYVGHPFDECKRFDIRDLCRPNPCGQNADCTPGKDRSGDDRPVCTCPEGFLGDPLVSCTRGDCLTHNDCADNRACVGYICEDPCSHRHEVCGTNAECESKNHGAVCRCPRSYTGQPLVECRYDPQSTQPVNFRRTGGRYKREAKYWPFI